jgi:hypothetical protein
MPGRSVRHAPAQAPSPAPSSTAADSPPGGFPHRGTRLPTRGRKPHRAPPVTPAPAERHCTSPPMPQSRGLPPRRAHLRAAPDPLRPNTAQRLPPPRDRQTAATTASSIRWNPPTLPAVATAALAVQPKAPPGTDSRRPEQSARPTPTASRPEPPDGQARSGTVPTAPSAPWSGMPNSPNRRSTRSAVPAAALGYS